MTKGLVLLSGGIESTTLAYELTGSGVELEAIFLKTCDSKSAEKVAVEVARSLGIPLEIVDITGVNQLMHRLYPEELALFDEMDGGGSEFDSANFNGSPIVSAFPVILSVATYYAQCRGLDKIYLGVEKDQVDTHPLFSTFFEGWGAVFANFHPSGNTVELVAPYAEIRKWEVVKKAIELGIAVENLWSCFSPTEIHCGECSSCVARKRAFQLVQVEDLTEYSVYS